MEKEIRFTGNYTQFDFKLIWLVDKKKYQIRTFIKSTKSWVLIGYWWPNESTDYAGSIKTTKKVNLAIIGDLVEKLDKISW